ncbi:GspH/FimT family pseudopilin [Cupriavidus sp. 30B13]|uniref:GspH/FimT family pseudopilin n=1 Tax=Cupriavidus sp. 30B13 TaxID=3384241 RepID=UPI003B8ED378
MGQPSCQAAAGLATRARARPLWAPGKAPCGKRTALAGSRPCFRDAAAAPSALRHPRNRPAPCRPGGFTLIELMVALSVLAILAAAAIPNFSSFLHRSRITSESSRLVSDIETARSEAARRNATVTICPTMDGASCTDDWSRRRVIFVDADNDGQIGAGEEVIRNSDAPTARTAIVASNIPSGTVVRFRSFGASTPPNAAWQFCEHGSANDGLTVSLTGTGRAGSRQAACSAS